MVQDDQKNYEEEEIECNGHIIHTIAEDMSLNIGMVEDILDHFSKYTANIVRSGNLEGIMIPYLGKIQIKPYTQQYRDFRLTLDPAYRGYLKGNKEINDMFFNKTNKETDGDETVDPG